MIVSVGFFADAEGKTLPSTMFGSYGARMESSTHVPIFDR